MSSAIILLAAFVAVFSYANSSFIPKREGVDYSGRDLVIDPKKRPFCNAFTGCGRKRSNLPPAPEQFPFKLQIPNHASPNVKQQRRVLDESMNNLLELSNEPGVDDLSRQILSEAKLWEAIQEANIARREEEAAMMENVDNAVGVSADTQKMMLPKTACMSPPCYVL